MARRARAPSPSSPSAPMPTSVSQAHERVDQQRVDGGGGQGAAAAAAAQGDPGDVEAARDQRLLALGRADEPHRESQDRRRPLGPVAAAARGDGTAPSARCRSRPRPRRAAGARARPRPPSGWCRGPAARAAVPLVVERRARPGCRLAAASASRRPPPSARRPARPRRRASAARPAVAGIAVPGELGRDVRHAAGMDQPQHQAVQRGREPVERHLGADQLERAGVDRRPGRAR